MKALTLLQPWATLVATGRKRFETRSWQTRHRGPLLIASAKHFPYELAALSLREPFRGALGAPSADTLTAELEAWLKSALPLGVLLGVVTVVQCHPTAIIEPRLTPEERAFGDFGQGRYAWELTDARPLPTPIPFRGALGVYEVPDDLLPESFRAGTTT